MKKGNDLDKKQLFEYLDFPVSWENLGFPKSIRQHLQEIAKQIKKAAKMGSLGRSVRHSSGRGIIAMFVGSNDKSKTLAAAALASELNLALYRVDSGHIVSKYIGETEKNLKSIFDSAIEKGAILLFDEADALFGKRSMVTDSHDRYANIEISHLLQHMESFQGLTILSTNTKRAFDQDLLAHLDFVIELPSSIGS